MEFLKFFKKYYFRFIVLVFTLLVVMIFVFYNNNVSHSEEEFIPTDANSKYSALSSSKNTSSLNDGTDVHHISVSDYNKLCDWKLYLINIDNPLEKDYPVQTKSYDGYSVDVRIYDSLSNMIAAAVKDGIYLYISSAYRTNDYQQGLFNDEINSYLYQGFSYAESYNLAKNSVATPGTSEHQIGLAVDLNNVSDSFKTTTEYQWLCSHAKEYGFIERYPDGKSNITKIIYEPWHYRYVGVENAYKIEASGLCLEEYVEQVLIPEMEQGGQK